MLKSDRGDTVEYNQRSSGHVFPSLHFMHRYAMEDRVRSVNVRAEDEERPSTKVLPHPSFACVSVTAGETSECETGQLMVGEYSSVFVWSLLVCSV